MHSVFIWLITVCLNYICIAAKFVAKSHPENSSSEAQHDFNYHEILSGKYEPARFE